MSDIDLDFERKDRIGMPEIIYGEYKNADQIKRIAEAHAAQQANLFITRVAAEKVQGLDGSYDAVAQTFTRLYTPAPQRPGLVGVVAAGSSDAPVAQEAANTLAVIGCQVENFLDCGVAGVHRLLKHRSKIDACDVIICVAGFEGALASVIAGLFHQPIIGVPTSVGYGVSAGGHAALNAMLASCAGGVVTMNIDNGCGAALAAHRILFSLQQQQNKA